MPRRPPQENRDLCLCETCGSKLVEPIAWQSAGHEWHVVLRCPNCEHTTEGVFSQQSVDRYDARLDEGTEILVRDLKALQRANMEEEIERFVGALDAGAILPEDFAPTSSGTLTA